METLSPRDWGDGEYDDDFGRWREGGVAPREEVDEEEAEGMRTRGGEEEVEVDDERATAEDGETMGDVRLGEIAERGEGEGERERDEDCDSDDAVEGGDGGEVDAFMVYGV